MSGLVPENRFETALRALRTGYLERLPEKLAEIVLLRQRIAADPGDDLLQMFQRATHTLAGSGATYGFAEISVTSRRIEHLIMALLSTDTDEPLPLADIDTAIAALRTAIEKIHHGDVGVAIIPVQSGDTPRDLHVAAGTTTVALSASLDDPPTALVRPVMLIDPSLNGDDLAMQLSYFGYQIYRADPAHAIGDQIRAHTPAAIISVISAATSSDVTVALTANRTAGGGLIPLVFISDDDTLTVRLNAVRAGGDAYFVRPLDAGQVVDTLDELTGQRAVMPFRVLIVEDDPLVSSLYTAILENAGMHAHVVNDPLQVMGPLDDFQPDLALVDLNMPGCTGIELASVIRQHTRYLSMPIVFLSGETDRELQLAAMLRGGDDFLEKKHDPHHVIASVRSRAERARDLRAQMVRDGLTGLLNHTAIENNLERELIRSQRTGSPLTMALLDIDHFKKVNDSHGHPMGDRVLKSLARLLQQRLRRSDIIGRYGGEEFAIILPDTDANTAYNVLDDVRMMFSQVRHQSEDSAFTVTLSGGLASSYTHHDAATITSAADVALYMAKRTGRHRLVLAGINDVAITNLPPPPPPIPVISDEPVAPRMIVRGNQASGVAHVLVVDDDNDISSLLANWLLAAGCRVDVVSSGEEVVNLLEVEVPDVVFLDVLMPGINGLQVLDLIRDAEYDTSVIINTAFSSELIAVDALRRGADDYLRKPFSQRDFETTIERTISRLQLRRQNAALRQQIDRQQSHLTTELRRAARVHADLRADVPPPMTGYQLAVHCTPGDLVGGDFYYWQQPVPGVLNIALGNVAERGMPGAMLMTMVRAVLRSTIRETAPQVNMRYTAEALTPELQRTDDLLTLLHAQLTVDNGVLRYVSAGHQGAVVLRAASAAMMALDTLADDALGGVLPHTETEYALDLKTGDALILFSNALYRHLPARAARDTLIAAICAQPDAADKLKLLQGILEQIGPQHDDSTILVIQRA